MNEGGPQAGALLRLEVGAVAHGGHCVARHEGRVVFVRHALPGEQVLARLTEAGAGARYWRADAVQILVAAPDRVPARCPLAHPGGCGGCDWQHVSTAGQRRLKAAVVAEQMRRLAGIDLARQVPGFQVEPVPGDADGLGWRTRIRFAVDAEGRPGLHPHRSHEVLAVPSCPIAHPAVNALDVPGRRWHNAAAVEVVAPGAGSDRLVVVHPADPDQPVDVPPLAGEAALARADGSGGLHRLRGRAWVRESVLVDGRPVPFRVSGAGFWQVHPGGAQTLLDAVLAGTAPRPGERALDLYAGSGLFSAGLAARVGPGGEVVAVESDQRAVADAKRSLHDLPTVRIEAGRVGRVLAQGRASGRLQRADVVVLDPPRSGAGRAVIAAVAELRPRAVCYVACDPATLARDLAALAGHGYHLGSLRGFDLFPMTHHVECVALAEAKIS